MPVRKAEAEWNGTLREGSGQIKVESGSFATPYSFVSRFESGKGTNPEELIAAAHAGCFSMALAGGLVKAKHQPKRVHTTASVKIDNTGAGFEITHIHLECEAEVPGLDNNLFQAEAKAAKEGCPISKALKAVEISLTATLVGG